MPRPLATALATLSPLLLALAGAEGMPHATNADAARVALRFPQSSQASLEDGRRLYVQRCGGCHALREPASLPPEAWPERVDEMQKDKGVRLSSDDAHAITAYLVALSSR